MQQRFPLAAGASIGPVSLDFSVQAILVDNPGGQWVHLPSVSAYTWVAPYTMGYVAVPAAAAPVAVADTTPPPGQTNTGQGSPATVTFTDQAAPAGSGTALGPSLNPRGIVVATGSFGVSGTASQSYPLSAVLSGLVTNTPYNCLGYSFVFAGQAGKTANDFFTTTPLAINGTVVDNVAGQTVPPVWLVRTLPPVLVAAAGSYTATASIFNPNVSWLSANEVGYLTFIMQPVTT